MKTDRLNSQTNFSSHLLPKHISRFSHIDPSKAEKYFAVLGVDAKFYDNKFFAAINIMSVKIFKKLGLPLPQHIRMKYFKPQENCSACTVFSKDKKKHRIMKHLAVLYNKRFMSKRPLVYNERVNEMRRYLGNTHFLNITLHEYMHSVLYRKIYDALKYWHKKWDTVINKKFSNIDLSPFKKEIAQKLGGYAKTDAMELHAVYWTQEICKALNSNLTPKYNPFETPKIKLSPLLREFITKISNADYNGAKAVSRRARKLQQGV